MFHPPLYAPEVSVLVLPQSGRRLPGARWPVVVAVLAALAAGSAGTLAGVVVPGGEAASTLDVVWLCSWVSFAVVGALVLVERPGHRAGQAFLALGFLIPLAGLVDVLSFVAAESRGRGSSLVAWLRLTQDVTFSAALGLVVCTVLLLPDGRLARRWMLWPARLTLVAALGPPLVSLLNPGAIGEDLPVDNPLGIPGAGPFLDLLGGVCAAALLAGAMVGLLSLLLRAKGAVGATRAQLSWLGLGVLVVTVINLLAPVMSGLGVVVSDDVGALISTASVVVIPICVAMAVLRHNLFDVELLLRRSLLYSLLSAAILGLYLMLAAALGLTVDAGGGSALLGAAVALVVFPLRDLGQRWLDRRFYGQASDPYGVLSGLGRQLTEAVRSEDVPQAVADSVRSALRLPWAAVELGSEVDPVGIAESGDRPDWSPAVVPLLVHGVEVGRLLASSRGPRDPLQERDTKLLVVRLIIE